jgi:aminoglycoside 3-N-acetyltransferase
MIMTQPSPCLPQQPNVLPDELTEGFLELGLREGDHVVLHASLRRIGAVEGGPAMLLHRLLKVLGKEGTLLMPTFTSVTRHSATHDDFTKGGCWCGGMENRHLPFILELQPDKQIGEIAHRLCSWPASRRSKHPAFSFVAVGRDSDKLVRNHSLEDPMQPLKIFLKEDPFVLTLGVNLDSVRAIHIPEQRRLPYKFVKERALTIAANGPSWVEVTAIGCSRGFQKLMSRMNSADISQTEIGSAKASLYSMKKLIGSAEAVLDENPVALTCGRPECLSCNDVRE